MEGQNAMSQQQGEPHLPIRGTVRRRARSLLVLGLLIVLFALGAGGWWYWQQTTKETSQNQRTDTSSQNQDAARAISTVTKHYVSPALMVEFDYPDNWTVDEPDNSGILTVTSPLVDMSSGSQAQLVNIVLTVRNKQQDFAEFDTGSAVAAADSEKLSYAKPSSVQRGSTYVTFARYSDGSSSGTIDGLYITGDTGYREGQTIPKADFTPVDPLISITFAAKGSSTTVAHFWGSAADSSLTKSIKALLESFIIQ